METESQWSDLATEVEDWFGFAAVERGWKYFDAGRVTLQHASDNQVRATVQGSRRRPYQVCIEVDPVTDEPFFSCDCPAARRAPCKHVFATMLALTAPESGAPTPDWRDTLDAVEPAETRDPWAGIAEVCSRPAFVLSAVTARTSGTIALRVMHRRPLASGGWSAPERVRDNGSVRWDAPGERLYDRVRRASSGAETYLEFGRVDGQLRLAPERTHDVLVELAQAGALHLATERGRAHKEPARFDDGPPFEFRMNLERADTIRLSGYFRRGERRLAPEEPELLLSCGLMILDEAIVPVDFAGAWFWAVHLRDTGALELPAEAFPAVVASLSEHGDPPPLDQPLPVADAPPVVAQLCLRDELTATPEYAEFSPRHVRADVDFLYGDCVVPADSPATVGVDPRSGATVPRDRERERALLTQLLECGARPTGPLDECTARLPRNGGASIVGRLLRAGWRVEGDGHEWRQPDALSFRVTTGIDWFELEGGVQFGEKTVALPEVLRALRSGVGVVALDDGSRGLLPDGLDERLALVTHLAKQADGKLRFRRNQGWLLDALLAEHDATLDADAGFAKLRRRVAEFDRVRPRDAGEGFAGELRPYQRDALGWLEFLRSMGLGGCLADDMGLGKTVMVLAHLLHGRNGQNGTAGRKPALVVAPKSLAWNWIDEARRFAPSLRVLDYSGPAATRDPAKIPEHDLVVTTYGVLRRDAADLKDIPLGYAILDEAQTVKNPASQAWKAARLLRADQRLALTGTPVENHLGDLWAILEFLNPGMLGPRATHRAWAKASGDEADLRARVARLVRPVLLRRTKEQVLNDLPPKQETLLHCDLGPTQRRLYDELLDHYRATLLDKVDDEGMARARFHVLEALLRLRQCACHPGLLDEKRADRPAAKFDTLLPLLEEVRDAGAKALVFSQFTSLLSLLQDRLDAAGIPYAYLDGKTRQRDEVVRGFAGAPETPLFLISLKAGGVGLNLTAADHVFLLDPWWNPAVERQAVDRTHRIGQTRTVNVYRLVAADTVEERILELQARKREVAQAVVGEDAGLLRKITRDDLAALLRA